MTEKLEKTIKPRAIWPGLKDGVPKPIMPYSPAIKVGDWVFIAGQLASDFKTGLPSEVIPNSESGAISGLELQSDFIYRNIEQTLQATGCNMKMDTMKTWEWFVSEHPNQKSFLSSNNSHRLDIKPYENSMNRSFQDYLPPRSSIGISELMWVGTQIELEVICLASQDESIYFSLGGDQSEKSSMHTDAIRKGDWIFTSNQNGMDEDGLSNDSIELQTERMLEKLLQISEKSGSSFEQSVKAEVFIGDSRDFAVVDKIWKKWFPNNPPARFVLPHSGMNHRDIKVEASLMLLTDESHLKKEVIEASDAPKPLGHEPQAIKVGNLLFFSTQMAFDNNGKLAEGMTRNPAAPWYGRPAQTQMRYMMENINAISEAADTTVENIVRRACFHDDLQWFAESIESWASYFPNDKPASTTIGMNHSLGIDGANTSLDLIAFVPDDD
jgi:enamine deaminase RidA (YjgF/YER057c/UK114 family)|tara:strand:- start:62 stop:1381 length:1320 start_codon:yes stop_codon:yes gene_type:complete